MAAALPSLPAPLWARVALTLLLPLIALVIYLEGQHYDPGLMELKPAANSPGNAWMPKQLGELTRLGPVRRYTAENLYEYINGHAEYYLDAGFKGLTVGEFGPAGAQQPELVINLYNMGEPLHAFGVLMDELAPDAVPLDAGGMGFAMEQGVNLIYGPYYAQVTAFSGDREIPPLAQAFAELLAAETGDTKQLDLSFPNLGDPLETYFVKEDYRGLGVLDNVLEKTFLRGEEELTAFLITGSPETIQRVTDELTSFLEADGLPFERAAFDGRPYIRVDDPYEGEWFFAPREHRLLGVFGAPSSELLEQVMN